VNSERQPPAQGPELPYLRGPAHFQEFIAAEEVRARDLATGQEEIVFDPPLLKADGTFEPTPVRTMTIPIDRARGELEMLQRDCLTFKGRHR
jgi:hypothetical protein